MRVWRVRAEQPEQGGGVCVGRDVPEQSMKCWSKQEVAAAAVSPPSRCCAMSMVEVECQQEAEAAHLSVSSGVVEVECQQEAEAAHLCASRMPHDSDESDA